MLGNISLSEIVANVDSRTRLPPNFFDPSELGLMITKMQQLAREIGSFDAFSQSLKGQTKEQLPDKKSLLTAISDFSEKSRMLAESTFSEQPSKVDYSRYLDRLTTEMELLSLTSRRKFGIDVLPSAMNPQRTIQPTWKKHPLHKDGILTDYEAPLDSQQGEFALRLSLSGYTPSERRIGEGWENLSTELYQLKGVIDSFSLDERTLYSWDAAFGYYAKVTSPRTRHVVRLDRGGAFLQLEEWKLHGWRDSSPCIYVISNSAELVTGYLMLHAQHQNLLKNPPKRTA